MKQFRSLIMTTLITMTSFIAQQSIAQPEQPSFADPFISNSVKYIGMKDDLLVFEVRLGNNVQKGTTLSIPDEKGNEIYSERIKTSSFVKRYMFAKNTISKIQFNIKGRRQIMNETFNVNFKMEERLEVSKA